LFKNLGKISILIARAHCKQKLDELCSTMNGCLKVTLLVILLTWAWSGQCLCHDPTKDRTVKYRIEGLVGKNRARKRTENRMGESSEFLLFHS
jgi:hypothetical protein